MKYDELLIVVFAVNVVFAGYCCAVADAKNLTGFLWFLGGLIFGPVALIAVAGMPVKENKSAK